MQDHNDTYNTLSADEHRVDIKTQPLSRAERRKIQQELENTRKKHARKLAILSCVLSFSIYKALYLLLANSAGVQIPVKWILIALVFILGSLAQFWHKKYKISIQHAAAATTIGSMVSLTLLIIISMISAST